MAPDRRLGFAEFGPPKGRARRQIPHEARLMAESGLGVGEEILHTLLGLWDATLV